MSILNIILILVACGVATTFTVILILFIKSMREHPETIMNITNHLYRFCDNHKYGKLIKVEPTGKNMEYLRVVYSAEKKDEYNEKEIVYHTIVVKKSHTMQTVSPEAFIIFPQSFAEVDPHENDYEEIKKFITANRVADTIAGTYENSIKTLNDIYMSTGGGQIYEQHASHWQKIAEATEKKEEAIKNQEVNHAQNQGA